MVGGQRVEVFLSPEWGRYFQSLNTVVDAGPATNDKSAGFALALGESESVELIQIPGPQGQEGAQGPAGPALYLLQEPETNDVFWPIKNT